MILQITGTIKTINEVEKVTSKAGKEWEKLTFVVANNDGYEGKEQIFAFEVFGAEKVESFKQYNQVGKAVDVSFNISTNEWKGKYFTSLNAWKIFGSDAEASPQAPQEEEEPLPF